MRLWLWFPEPRFASYPGFKSCSCCLRLYIFPYNSALSVVAAGCNPGPYSPAICGPIPISRSRLDLARLEVEAGQLFSLGIPSSTLKACASGRARYRNFCRSAALSPLPTSEYTLSFCRLSERATAGAQDHQGLSLRRPGPSYSVRPRGSIHFPHAPTHICSARGSSPPRFLY